MDRCKSGSCVWIQALRGIGQHLRNSRISGFLHFSATSHLSSHPAPSPNRSACRPLWTLVTGPNDWPTAMLLALLQQNLVLDWFVWWSNWTRLNIHLGALTDCDDAITLRCDCNGWALYKKKIWQFLEVSTLPYRPTLLFSVKALQRFWSTSSSHLHPWHLLLGSQPHGACPCSYEMR